MPITNTRLLDRLFSAYKVVLDENIPTQKKLLEVITERRVKKGKRRLVEITAFSKYLDPERKYIAQLSELTLKFLVDDIDEILNEQGKFEWNANENKYTPILKVIRENETNNRIKALSGLWLGYSWNSALSKEYNYEKNYYHVFKIHIDDNGRVRCGTKAADLESTKVDIVLNRLIIELRSLDRIIYIIIHIGSADANHLRKRKKHKIVYCDTGDKRIRTGVAIIRRSEEDYETFAPHNLEESKMIHPEDVQYLLGKQFVIE
jgi:hypothetical protein